MTSPKLDIDRRNRFTVGRQDIAQIMRSVAAPRFFLYNSSLVVVDF
jgi:hypothetical protein